MRIAAASDFHIGVCAETDAFGHNSAKFTERLRGLLATHDRLVLLGDIFQADHTLRWGAQPSRSHLIRALARCPHVEALLRHPRVRYVHGNHDLIAAEVLGAAERVTLAAHGLRVVFTHGHQFDPVALRAPRVADAGTWLTGRMRAVGLARWASWFEGRDVAVKDRRFRGSQGPYAQAANVLCEEEAAQVVVMGHTHAARADRIDRGWSLNTGTCSGGRFQWVSLDLSAKTAQVRRDDVCCAVPLGHTTPTPP